MRRDQRPCFETVAVNKPAVTKNTDTQTDGDRVLNPYAGIEGLVSGDILENGEKIELKTDDFIILSHSYIHQLTGEPSYKAETRTTYELITRKANWNNRSFAQLAMSINKEWIV